MHRSIIETVLGAVVLTIAAIFLVFAYNQSQVRAVGGYLVLAKFGQVDGLAIGDDVRVGGRRWNLRLHGGVEVRLPAGEEARAWHRLAALEREHAILGRDLVAIDLRLPDRLIVRMAPGAAERAREPGEKT